MFATVADRCHIMAEGSSSFPVVCKTMETAVHNNVLLLAGICLTALPSVASLMTPTLLICDVS